VKRAAFADQAYWGRPLPGFGDPNAKLWVVGLAPAAHGGNRTGRMFTGDRSGDWLYRALFRIGFANQPLSVSAADGLRLDGAYISAIVRCAPPDNKPTILERDRCLPYLFEEFERLKRVRVIVALGSFAWDGVLRGMRERGIVLHPKPKFGHAVSVAAGPYRLIGCYHPSQQNTFTGKLSEAMLENVFKMARQRI